MANSLVKKELAQAVNDEDSASSDALAKLVDALQELNRSIQTLNGVFDESESDKKREQLANENPPSIDIRSEIEELNLIIPQPTIH